MDRICGEQRRTFVGILCNILICSLNVFLTTGGNDTCISRNESRLRHRNHNEESS